jgi:pilus assembly protein CpaB
MKKLQLILSLGAALGSVGLAHLYLQRLEAEVSGGPKVQVLAAAEDVPVGATLKESSLAVRDVPQAYVEGRNIRATDIKKVLGARVSGGLKSNEVLLWSDLAQFSDHSRVLSGLVQNGMRAVSIDSRTADFDGLLRPGDRVDVLFSTGTKEDNGGSTVTLLQNLLVLSVGGNITRAEDGANAGVSRGVSVSLSATLEQAQLLTHAAQRGRLALTLRNSDDIRLIEGVQETGAKDLALAKDRADWRQAKDSPTKGAIDHVR